MADDQARPLTHTPVKDGDLRRCAATTKAGRPCRMAARPGRDYCPFHDPELDAVRADGRQRGGRNRRRRPTAEQQAVLVQTLADAIALLAEEIAQARDVAEPGLSRLRAVAYSLLTWAKLYETGELAARVAALEAALDQRQGGAK